MAAQGRAIYDRRMDTRLPIVFVRGWAGGLSGIDNAVNDPFYGFNNGSTHVWNLQDEDDRYYQFGGPMQQNCPSLFARPRSDGGRSRQPTIIPSDPRPFR